MSFLPASQSRVNYCLWCINILVPAAPFVSCLCVLVSKDVPVPSWVTLIRAPSSEAFAVVLDRDWVL